MQLAGPALRRQRQANQRRREDDERYEQQNFERLPRYCCYRGAFVPLPPYDGVTTLRNNLTGAEREQVVFESYGDIVRNRSLENRIQLPRGIDNRVRYDYTVDARITSNPRNYAHVYIPVEIKSTPNRISANRYFRSLRDYDVYCFQRLSRGQYNHLQESSRGFVLLAVYEGFRQYHYLVHISAIFEDVDNPIRIPRRNIRRRIG